MISLRAFPLLVLINVVGQGPFQDTLGINESWKNIYTSKIKA